MSTTPAVPQTAHVVTASIGDTFAQLDAAVEPWRATMEDLFASETAPTAATIEAAAGAFVRPALTAPGGLITGAGFIAAPEAVADAPWYLAWWMRSGGEPERLAFTSDPHNAEFRDYTMLEWWRVPASTLTPHLTGPYVDYVCTEDYTLTLTVPVFAHGTLIGVVGADSLVDRLEREILPAMRTLERVATVVNASGRVVTSTDTRRDPGSLLRVPGLTEGLRASGPIDLADGTTVLPCGATSLALVLDA